MDKRQWIVVLVLAGIQFTHVMDFMIMMPLGPSLMRIFQISPTQFGLAVSAYTLSAGIFGFLASFFIDRYDRKTMLLLVYCGFIFGTLACGLSIGFGMLVLSRIFSGAFGGILGALILSIISDVFPVERRATAMGTVMAAFSVASVVGVPSGLYLASVLHWHVPFFAIVAISVPILILVFVFFPELNTHIHSGSQNIGNSLSNLKMFFVNRRSLLAMCLMLALMFGQFTIIPYIAAYMVSNVGFEEGQLALIYLVGGAFTIFTSPGIGRLADLYGHAKLFLIMGVLSFVPIYILTNLQPVALYMALTVTTLFFIVGGGRMSPAFTLMTTAVSPQKRGQFMSIITSLQQLGSGMAAYIGGLIIFEDQNGLIQNYAYLGYITLFFTFVSMIIVLLIKKTPSDA